MALDKKAKILLVDDFSMMRKVIANILKQLGYENFLEAEDGIKALEMIRRENDYALIIIDWHMPNMNGLELLKAIRANEATENLPVIMVTAEALQKNIITAIKAGVNNCIVKPFDAKTMKEKLDKVFGP